MVEIKLHNTRTRKKEVFTPIDVNDVRMYVCGPTVYDRAHLGNARPVVVFDVLNRLLRHVYGEDHVTYVRNFTDVDDKIIARAEESGREIGQITSETTQWFLEDMAALGAREPDHMPRATQYIGQMVTMIEELIAGGHAYEAEGHVLFAVESYENYGALSGRTVKDMIAGSRVEVAPYKLNPMDFVLWKPSSGDQPGWESPWGYGRPGWHIECSAMSYELLGDSFDIHGGGNDLMFPHHENEIAQSCCAHPKGDFARYWMHNEMLQVEGKKMSKSLGNFFTVRDLLEQGVPGEVIRFVFLSTHYRKPMDWTAAKAENAKKTLEKWRALIENVRGEGDIDVAVVECLSNDLNTSQVLTELTRLADQGNGAALKGSARLVGLLTDELGDWFSWEYASFNDNKNIVEILRLRAELRRNKAYEEADSLRHALNLLGVAVFDRADGSYGFPTRGLLGRARYSEARKLHEAGNQEELFKFLDDSSQLGVEINIDGTGLHGFSSGLISADARKKADIALEYALEDLRRNSSKLMGKYK